MLEPPEDYYELVADSEEEDVTKEVTDIDIDCMPSVTSAEWPGARFAKTQDSQTTLFRVFRTLSLRSQPSLSHASVGCLVEPQVIRIMRVVAEKTPIQHLMQPPLIASMLAILVGLFPNANSIIFGDDAPLGWFTDSLTILGAAMVPCVMLVLGGTFSVGP